MRILAMALVLMSTSLNYAQKETFPDQEQDSLEQIVIKGNRLQTPFSQSTRDVQIVTQKDIQSLPVHSLNEVLGFVPGVDIRQRGPFGSQADISIDGGTSEQVLVLIDGVKMLDAQTAHNMMNLPLPLSAIDHIEIIRGPAARIYGINSLTGAINIVTRKGARSEVIAGVSGGSSFQGKDEREGSGIYAGVSGEVTGVYASEEQSHLLAMSFNDYNGQRYNSASKNARLFYKGDLNINDQNAVRAMIGVADSRFGANGFYAAPKDTEAEELVRSSLFSLSSVHRINDFTFSPRISDRYGEDDYRFYKNDLSKARSKHFTNTLMLELNGGLTTHYGNFGVGWESRWEEINSSNIGQHARQNHGAYAEYNAEFVKRWNTSMGVYANFNTDYGWQLYPGLEVAYAIRPSLKLSASIGSGQRIPSFSDLYLNQKPANVGNPRLVPEEAWSYEANLTYSTKNKILRAGYFYRGVSQFIDWVRMNITEPYSPINGTKTNIQGIYGSFKQRVEISQSQNISYWISYNYLSPDLREMPLGQSKYILESLKHQLIVGLQYRFGRFSTQLINRWHQRERGAGYNITDLNLAYQMNRLEIAFIATNLLNASYKEAGAVPMPGRWISVGLRYWWERI